MRRRGRDILVAAALLLAASRATFALTIADAATLSGSTEAFVSPSTASYSAFSGTVGEIRIRQRNVFDPTIPGEDWWPFKVANIIHFPTKRYVIRREILLDEGAPYDPLKTLESERNLRASRFIRSAELKPVPGRGGKLDIDALTQDSWTTMPQFSVGTEGGDTYFIWGMEERNVFGYGKSASAYHAQVGPVIRNEVRYFDPRLFGTWANLTSLYATTNRGTEAGAGLVRPFYSLDSRYSFSLVGARIRQEDTLYQNAKDFSRFNQSFRAFQSGIGLRLGDSRDPVHRVLVGTGYERDAFSPTVDTVAGTLPQDREISGPVLGYSLIQPHYVKETFIDKMKRVEDFNLGNELSVVAGPGLRSWGSDRDRWLLSALDQQGVRFAEGRFALFQAGVQGRLERGIPRNSIFYANGNLYWKTVAVFPQTWVAHLEWNTTRNLDGEKQLLLGGNTGLRGYRNNSFAGTRSVLLNFEDRTFLTREFFHLFYAGGVVFFETGSVSGRSLEISWPNLKSDVGFGLRFSPTRSTTGEVLRMDVAYALNGGPGPSRWVFSIRGSQAFQIFNSTNKDILRTPLATVTEDNAGARLRQR
ncbi:MAG: hypothetical protein HY078_15925 [Elusimicrobia bacterium]|nr:hypothetical protein [Elusimicrobiota bacterium]